MTVVSRKVKTYHHTEYRMKCDKCGREFTASSSKENLCPKCQRAKEQEEYEERKRREKAELAFLLGAIVKDYSIDDIDEIDEIILNLRWQKIKAKSCGL